MRFMGAEVTERTVSVCSVKAMVFGEWNLIYEKPEHYCGRKNKNKKKRNASLYTPRRHIEGVVVELHLFLTSALGAGEWLASRL